MTVSEFVKENFNIAKLAIENKEELIIQSLKKDITYLIIKASKEGRMSAMIELTEEDLQTLMIIGDYYNNKTPIYTAIQSLMEEVLDDDLDGVGYKYVIGTNYITISWRI